MNTGSSHHNFTKTRIKSQGVIFTRDFNFDKSAIKKISLDYIVTNRNRPLVFTLIYSAVAFFIVFQSAHFVLSSLLYQLDFNFIDYIFIIIASVISIFSCIFLIGYILNTNRFFIYNRKNGTLSMQSSILNRGVTTTVHDFKDMYFVAYSFKYITFSKLIFPNASYWTILFVGKNGRKDFFTYISYLCLFMDKNRPLPASKEFDKFREEDDERRKKEGSQPPLFEDISEDPIIKEMLK